MNNINSVKKEIDSTINFLVQSGMSAYQQYPIIKSCTGAVKKLEWSNITNLSICLKNMDYSTIYSEIDKNKDYTIKLIDGNIVQMMYTFKNDILYSHRLAMFPSPDLEMFQNQPEIYEQDEIYADIIRKDIVTFPIRFDYCAEKITSDHEHPYAHVSLGEYKNCRIPAYGPISPTVFMNFILESFYNTFFLQVYQPNNIKPICNNIFTIRENERNKVHFNIL